MRHLDELIFCGGFSVVVSFVVERVVEAITLSVEGQEG